MTRLEVSPIALLLALAIAAPARGDDAGTTAQDLLRQGVELRRAHRNEEALETFRRALALSDSPIARAQVALAEQAIARWLDAERDLAEAMKAESDPWIVKNRDALQAARAEVARHLGWLDISVDLENAEVRIDGRDVPRDVEQRVRAGSVVLEVMAAGYTPDIRHVDIPSEAHVHTSIVLVPLIAQTPTTASEPMPKTQTVAPSPVEAPRDLFQSPPSTGRVDERRTASLIGSVALGVAGVAAGGLGITWGIQALDEKHQRDALCAANGCAPTAFVHDAAARSASLESTAALGAGAATIAAGALWWLVDSSHGLRSREPTVAPFVLGMLGVGFAAAGGGLGALAYHDKALRDAQCSGGTCSPSALSYDSEARAAADMSTVAFVAGGTFAAAAVGAWVLSRRVSDSQVGRATFELAPGGAVLRGRFE
jgi:hypothetical protein